MKRRASIGRIIARVLAVGAFGFGVWFAWEWWHKKHEVEDAFREELAVLPDVLGAVGTIEVPLSSRHYPSHGHIVVLEPGGGVGMGEEPRKLLTGLKGNAWLLRKGEIVAREIALVPDLFMMSWWDPDSKMELPALKTGTIPLGEYVLKVSVEEPAEGSVGVSHRLVVRGQYCGVDRMVPFALGVIAFVLLLVGTIASFGLMATRKRSVDDMDSGSPEVEPSP
ncbi:MAG: hypothetical protein HN849_01795 [Victivallales bacterium]|jgi:hypothetical protein|nr:hypothetical protein [Victivallales bacterium]